MNLNIEITEALAFARHEMDSIRFDGDLTRLKFSMKRVLFRAQQVHDVVDEQIELERSSIQGRASTQHREQ